ncbi:MAG: cell division FtsA domain-containing protein [Eubacteriales bacterium]|nr:cell division FtsA domain-containing protein [Eubacteriales bacterium]
MKPAAVLDIGSSKVICLCGSFVNRDGITVHGVSVCPYRGYQNGAFSDQRSLNNAVVEAVSKAEQEARMRIREVAVSVPAPFCKIVMTEAALPIGSRGKRVTAEDIDDVISLSLKKVKLGGYVLMHSTPVSFSVGGVMSSALPTGAKTEELGALVSHMYVQESFLESMEQALTPLDIEVSMSVASQLCGALAIIPEKERVRPAILIDAGYLHTDVSLVENAALTDSRTIDIGGKQIASDLAFGLDIPLETAEQVKRRYVFLQEPLSSTEIVRTPVGAKRVDHGAIELIIEARAGELVSLIRAAIKDMGISPEASPVTYLTGGGIAMMKGGIDYLKRGLQLSIQRDTPWVADMDTPNYTSAFAALDFVLRATSDDVVTNTAPASLIDRLRNLFTK